LFLIRLWRERKTVYFGARTAALKGGVVRETWVRQTAPAGLDEVFPGNQFLKGDPMKIFKNFRCFLVAALFLALAVAGRAEAELTHWPKAAKTKLEALIKANANKGNYAVFDMDQTSYRYDLTEALLPFLEMKGALTRDKLDPSLKLIPFKDTADYQESLFSYYYRLCEIDDLVCYPWIAQSFAGLTLEELKGHVDEMLAQGKPVPVTYYEGDEVKKSEVNPPKIYPGMTELFNTLMENGIEVYVMTAANEEVVRMVAGDPKYGYNVKPENVIGVNVMLKDRETGALVNSRFQIKKGVYDQAKNTKLEVTPYLVNPMTWYEGKLGSILGWIDQWKMPVLVGGDTPISDGYMLLNGVDVKKGGVRVWVNRKEKNMDQMKAWWEESAKRQKELGLTVTADKNWIVVKPEDIQ
jgi:phosphoserine phosphatase